MNHTFHMINKHRTKYIKTPSRGQHSALSDLEEPPFDIQGKTLQNLIAV